MKEKEFVRFYVINGKIEWDGVSKDTLRVLYVDEVNDFITVAESGDFIKMSDDSILLYELVKNRIDPDDTV